MSEIKSVSLFSNYLNRHQLPLCLALASLPTVEEFHFVSLDRSLEVVGRKRLDDEQPFVIKAYESNDASCRAMHHAVNDDLVIFGDMAGQEQYVGMRANSGALCFRYAERLLKRGLWWRHFPLKIIKTDNQFLRYASTSMRFFCLCASAFTSYDLSLFGFPVEKCFKWGYFPAVEDLPCRQRGDSRFELLWVGRLIDWKRPDMALDAASYLMNKGCKFRLRIVGEGKLSQSLRRAVAKRGLSECVFFCGEQSHREVCLMMSEADALLVTSNRKEGWGAVINEAMSYGCVVVSSSIAGAAPYLIKDGENGFLFAEDDVHGMCEAIYALLNDRSIVHNMGSKARKTILQYWNAEEAASRLMLLAEALSSDDLSPFEYGPCSPAGVVTDDWYSPLLLTDERGVQ